MTDDHNDMHEDDHEGETVIAGDAVHEAPSDYEFSDDHGTAPADHTDDHGTLSSDTTDTSPGRRRSLLPILAAVGGVLVLGGVAWWQFGGISSSDTAFMPTTAPVASSAPAPVSPAPAPVEPAPAPLAPAAPPVAPTSDSMAGMAPAPMSSPSATALPTPVAQNTTPDLKPADAVNAALQPKPIAPAPAPAPATAAVPAPMAMPTAVMPMPVVAAKTSAPVLAMPSATNGNGGDPNIQSLATRMDVLQKDVEHLTTQLGQMTNALAASASPTGNQDIQHRLDVLEQKINTLHHGDTAQASTPTTLIVTENQPATHHAVKHKPHTPKVVQVKIHHPIHLAAAEPKPLAKPQEKWVLRSATPDQAWVSDSNTSRDLKQVKVGDTLPTIGRVTAIHQNGDDWVVKGTKGSIQ